ncbi:MAG: hypothetical protein ACLTNW_18175 [Mediterraneibacter gnavus]
MSKTSIRFLTIRKFWNSMTHTKTILPLTMFTPSSETSFWGKDLTTLAGLEETVVKDLLYSGKRML